MVSSSTSVYNFDSMVRIRRYHVYKTVWFLLSDEMLQSGIETGPELTILTASVAYLLWFRH